MSDREPEGRGRSRIVALVQELRKRRVIRTAVYYGGISVAVVEGAAAFAEPLGLPEGAVRALAVLAVSGFPLVVLLSWMYDVSGDTSEPRGMLGRLGQVTLVVSVGTLCVAVALGLWLEPPAREAVDGMERVPMTRIAVLPFDTPGASASVDALAQHLHGRLIEGLSAAVRARGVADPDRYTVISRAGVLPFAGGEVTVDSIYRALEVGTIVEGALESVGDSVRIRLRLIDAESADLLDSRVAEAAVGDPLELVDRLAEAAVSMLRQQLGDVVERRTLLLETRSSGAFQHVVWAEATLEEFRLALDRGDLGVAERSLSRADSLYREASRRDPEWVEPLILRGFLSDERAQLATARGSGGVRSVWARGLDLAERALAIAPADHRALHLRGTLRARLAELEDDEDRSASLRADAEADLREAILGNPTPARALLRLSELLALEGRYEEALEFGNRAYVEDRYLEDMHATLLRLFQYSLHLDRDSDAARHCAEGRLQFQGEPVFHDCLLSLMAWSDIVDADPDSAWATMENVLAGYPRGLRPALEPRLQATVAAVLAGAGLADSARSVLARAERAGTGTVGLLRVAAGTRARLGQTDEALADVRQLLRVAPSEAAGLSALPELRPLRGEPRFRAFLDSIETASQRDGGPG